MSTRNLLPCLIAGLLGGLTLEPPAAQARLSVALDVDGSLGAADAVVIGRVAGVKTTGRGTYQGTPVENLEVTIQTLGLLKGSVPPRFTMHHLREKPGPGPVLNGFHFVDLVASQSYILYLRRGAAGRLELVANEDSNLVTVSAAELSGLLARGPTRAPAERIVDHLSAQLAACSAACSGPIWLLSRSRTHRQRLLAAGARQAFLGHLVRIARKATDDNTILAAFTVLGQLDHRAILPELLGRICAPQSPGRPAQANTVSWLQGFPRDVELTALEQVARSARDPATRAVAARRAAYRRGHP